jgi:hypothetical protein
MPRTVTSITLALSLIAASSTVCLADENPMWKWSYDWVCTQGGALTCERGGSCLFGPAPATQIQILFERSEVKIGAEVFRISRHYSQRIEGSPLTDEVKIELSGNSVIWLSPVDAGGIWSNIWTGMIVEPRRGAILSVSRPLYCVVRELQPSL